jgi:predicted N-acetyltransferase YhbS
MTAYRIEPLGAEHNRTDFACGGAAPDRYFHKQVSQDARRLVTSCFVAVDEADSKVAGYYTLAAAGVLLTDLPASLSKRLPRYPSVPVARMGRLAVDQAHQGRKLGSALLWDAISRSMRSEVAVLGLFVDVKDQDAEAFYLHHGFVSVSAEPRQMILPFAKLRAKE